MKDLFGWLISVCRRWAIGSSHDNKTSRAIYGLALVLGFYLFGVLLNVIFLWEPGKWLTDLSWFKEAFLLIFAILIFAPLPILKHIFKKEVTEVYIKKYKPKTGLQNATQHFFAFWFCFLGWFLLAGPFLFYGSLFN